MWQGKSRRIWRVIVRAAWSAAGLGSILGVSAVQGRAQQTTASPGAQASSPSTAGALVLQPPTTSSLFNPYYGSVQVLAARAEVIKLSLDDALRLGLENNLGLVYARESEDQQRAERLQLLNILLPNIDIRGSHGLHQYNLQAQGFRPGLLSQLGTLFGSGSSSGGASSFPYITKVNETEGQAYLSQYLFNYAGYDLVRAYGHSEKAARYNSNSSRGLVILNVGTAYLRAVAARSQVADAQALLKADESVLYQSTERHKAGVAPNIDELRARVQYQAQQQSVIANENNYAKTLIALNRTIGLAPEQQVELTEASPYSDLDPSMQLEEAERKALAARQDYQTLLEQLRTDEYERKAATHERLPTVIFNSNYGITGVNGLVYHDTWAATGTLNIPIFQEAKFRSDRDTAEYQLQNTRTRLANLGMQIDQQLRDSLIDLRTALEVVRVARSNQDLAAIAQEQAAERFQAGVEDNLPTIQAESTLASAQTQYVTAVFQLNQARLGLARNLGLLGTGYDPALPGGHPVLPLAPQGTR